MQAVGGLFAMSADAVEVRLRRPFQWREFLEQSWFVARVSLAPTLLVAIPFTVLVSFTLNILLARTGRGGSVRCGCGVRRGHPGRPVGDGVDRGRRGCDGDVRGPGVAHHPRRDRRDGGAGHQPGAAAGHAAHAGLRAGGAAAQQPGVSSSASWAATSSRCSSRTSIPVRSPRASRLLTGVPEVIISCVKAALFGLIAGLVACYRGLIDHRRGRQGRRQRGQRNGGLRVHGAVRGQRGRHRHRHPDDGEVGDWPRDAESRIPAADRAKSSGRSALVGPNRRPHAVLRQGARRHAVRGGALTGARSFG